MQLKFQETDIVSFIQDLHYTFAYQANTKHIKLAFHSEVKELKAWIDPKNFDKVILNILSNAFKFTPEMVTYKSAYAPAMIRIPLRKR